MKLNFFLSLLFTGLVVAGCSSTPSKLDQGPVLGQTFSFVRPKPKPQPVFADPDRVIHEQVQSAITASLASRGIRKLESGGDITVAYMVIAGDNASIASIEDYFGYGRDAYKLTDKAYSKYTGGQLQYRAGTLLIDVLNTDSGGLLYRGHATRPLLQKLTGDQRAAVIKEAVEEILSEVRFNP